MNVNYVIGAAYCLFALYCAYYMHTNYVSLGEERSGMWNTADLTVGGLMALLVIEYARKRHMPLFILNIALILYAVYGYLVPGMFYHAGVSWARVISSSTVEMETGIFSNLPQIALTIIGSFLLVLSLLRGFGCIDSLLRPQNALRYDRRTPFRNRRCLARWRSARSAARVRLIRSPSVRPPFQL